MALAYTTPVWTDGSGTGISASQLQAMGNCIEGLVQGTDKAIHNIAMTGNTMTLTYADGTVDTITVAGFKSIVSITKTSSSGNKDTYTILYTDGTSDTFKVVNNADAMAKDGLNAATAVSMPNTDEFNFGVRKPGTTVGERSVVMGWLNTASGTCSFTQGEGTTASGEGAAAIGGASTASAKFSFAEGFQTTASELYSHAEGQTTTAAGYASHAEGTSSETYGGASHAEGLHTIAQGANQHVQGKYNVAASQYADIIGGGTDENNRLNIQTTDWSGNFYTAGDVTDGTGNVLSNKFDANKAYERNEIQMIIASRISVVAREVEW